MGIDANLAYHVARSKNAWGLSGSVCTLGVATARATPDELDRGIRSAGIEPVGTSDPFLRMGFESVESVDVSKYEGCDHILDLNSSALPDELKQRFDLVYDGGTLEHVFNVPAALRNIFNMLRPGGVVIHFSPTNGWVEHGFYQFSPTVFTDYYLANGYQVLDARLMKYETSRHSVTVHPYLPGWLDGASDGSLNGSWLLYFLARKSEGATSDKSPLQRQYANAHGAPIVRSQLMQLENFIPYRIVEGRRIDGSFDWRSLVKWRRGEGCELSAHVPHLSALSDGEDSQRSPLLLREDGNLIGPPHALHQDIRTLGVGRYSHWGERLYFSASDAMPEQHKYEYGVPADIFVDEGMSENFGLLRGLNSMFRRRLKRLRSWSGGGL